MWILRNESVKMWIKFVSGESPMTGCCKYRKTSGFNKGKTFLAMAEQLPKENPAPWRELNIQYTFVAC
jgi:hypothetical protein